MDLQMTLEEALQLVALGQQIVAAGAGVWAEVQAVLQAHGIDADNAALDRVIANATARAARAAADAGPS